jgi:hypothetical protein
MCLELRIYIALNLLLRNLTSSYLIHLMRSQNQSYESNNTYCILIPSSLVKECKFAVLPTITNIINLSLAIGVFPDQFKSCSVHPLLRKPDCEEDDLSNYRPFPQFSQLSKQPNLLSKIALQILVLKITCLIHLNLPILNITPLTLYSLQFMIMLLGIIQQQIACVCLLGLSAAFDSIDHCGLIEHLSSLFGISGSALKCIKS